MINGISITKSEKENNHDGGEARTNRKKNIFKKNQSLQIINGNFKF